MSQEFTLPEGEPGEGEGQAAAPPDQSVALVGFDDLFKNKGQAERLAELAKQNGWPPRLPFDLAMQLEPAADTFTRYKLTPEQGAELLQNEVFCRVLKAYRDIIVAEGVSFQTKARIAAEELLLHAYDIATDPSQPGAVRMDSIKWHAKVGRLEPEKGAVDGGVGGGFKLNITFNEGSRPSITMEGEAKEVKDADSQA